MKLFKKRGIANEIDATEDAALYDKNDSSDEESLKDVTERMVDISVDHEEEFHCFFDE